MIFINLIKKIRMINLMIYKEWNLRKLKNVEAAPKF